MDTSERLTWPQIRDRYTDQWVVLVDHDWQEHDLTRYNTARVLAQGASRAEAVARARPALDAYQSYGCRYASRTSEIGRLVVRRVAHGGRARYRSRRLPLTDHPTGDQHAGKNTLRYDVMVPQLPLGLPQPLHDWPTSTVLLASL